MSNKKDNEQNISLKFKDNSKEIVFDISKNIVFYGLNGHGKTRVLKTIDLLVQLCKEKSLENSISIVRELNLEHLKIDGIDYNDIFNVTRRIEIEQNRNFKKQFNKNKDVFSIYELKLNEFNLNLGEFSDSIPRVLSNRMTILARNAPSKNISKYLDNRFLDKWLRDTYRTLRELNQFFDEIDSLLGEDIRELILLNRDLYHLIIRDSFKSIHIENEKYKKEMISKKDEIIKHLAIKNVIFISSELPKLDSIEKYIVREYTLVKDILFSSLYNQTTDSGIIQASERINSIHSKNDTLNKFMKRYSNIRMNITEEGELLFYKQGLAIEYFKLSSGEQRIIYLFITIIFNDADIYLIDEPEISLSLDYQNKIVSDLFKLTEGKTLMIATHAPFVYEDFQKLPNSTNIEI
ncbi:AAA family ATPase [Enterococcus casseliflavus]|uniref:AAA family ATPase n=1 Tax=Enterococcus casseliflavus TaxID=37734 RepID=UPI0034D2F825